MSDADTTIDWKVQIALIRQRFEASVRAGETLDSLDSWLQQVPDHCRDTLRQELENCSDLIGPESIETRILNSDASLGCVAPNDELLFSSDEITGDRAVRECSTFIGLSIVARDALRNRLVNVEFEAGTELLQQGEPARGLLLLISGNVDIIDSATGERIDCDGAGSVLGEMSLLTGQPCSAQVVATTDVKALMLSTEHYAELTASHPELEIALSQLVSDRLGGRRHDALCGKTIGNYRLHRCINRGGMGVVYEASPTDSDERVALKMLRHRFIYNEQMIDRFDQEARLLAELIHPNIVSFREHFLAYRTRFLVLDLCDGADLFRVLRRGGPMDEPTVRAIMGQIAEGLIYAHEAGVIHRDLKPGNVLLDRDGRIKLTDFGLSKLLKSEAIEKKAVGTPAYMPPEQFQTEDISPKADWYALGCLSYEMLTGKLLFPTDAWKKIFSVKERAFPSPSWPEFEASDELRDVILGAIQPFPSDRVLDLEKISRWGENVTGLI